MTNAFPNQIRSSETKNFISTGLWLLKTICIAAIAPYVVLAILFATFWLFGGTLADARILMVNYATMSDVAWSMLGNLWSTFKVICYGFVLGYRLLVSPLAENCNAWGASKLSTLIFKPLDIWFDNHPRMAALVRYSIPTLAMVATVALIIASPRPTNFPMPMAMPKAMDTAAIRFVDGTVKTGDATVTKESETQYVITFDK